MTRFPCSGCGRQSCEGECFTEDRQAAIEEVSTPPQLSAEDIAAYRKWCAKQDALRSGELGLVDVEHLKPRDGNHRIAA